jgi:glycosyltransferase involved in cell wall biosynthesis
MTAPTISIVVISHDYAQYLPAAIDSALAQTRPVEVLVVDDGSTDASPEVIRGYGDRIRSLAKENGGNSSVVNAAVPLSTGDVVMFLDADDLLHEEAAEEVARAWRDGLSKVQFRLSLIDAEGRRSAVDPPADVPMPTGDVVGELTGTGRYVTPVTTGNAFSRAVLERILPIPEQDFRNTNDGYLNLVAPFHGPIVSIDRELGSYRLHGTNLWAYSGRVDLAGIRQRIRYDLVRQRYLERTASEQGLEVSTDIPLRSPEHVLQRLVSLRTDAAGHPVTGDGVLSLTRAGLRAVAVSGDDADAVQRAVTALALVLVAVLPRRALLSVAEFVLLSRRRGPVVRGVARVARGVVAAVRRMTGRRT